MPCGVQTLRRQFSESSLQDHPGGVYVSVFRVPASRAAEEIARQTVGRIDTAAGRTGLAGMRSGCEQKASAPFGQFVVEHPFKFTPSLVQNGSVQTRFGGHVSAWVSQRSFCRTGHVPGHQVLQHNESVDLAPPCGELVQEIVTCSGDFLVQPGYAGFGFTPVLRKLLLPRQAALKAGQAGECSLQSVQRLHQLALGRGREHTHAPVDANCWRSPKHRVGDLELYLEDDVPAVGFAGDGCLFDCTRNVAAFIKPDPADLRQVDAAVFDFHTLREAEAIVAALLLEPGQFLKWLGGVESVLESSGQVFQFLLKNLGVRFGQEAVLLRLFPEPEQAAEVGAPQERDTAIKPVEVQAQRFIPGEARVSGHSLKKPFDVRRCL